ncbi:MAG: hypothetical protein NDJ19_07570 [Ramlibacter sp.]|nr:hypothetical protein [Ramlibacter sp.]
MKREMFFGVSGIIGAIFGLGFLLVPDMMLRLYGAPTEPHHLMLARYFGSALLTVGLTYFLARGTQEPAAVRALLVAGLVGNAAGAAISASAAGGLQNDLAWVTVVIYASIAAGAAYYLFMAKQPVGVQSA